MVSVTSLLNKQFFLFYFSQTICLDNMLGFNGTGWSYSKPVTLLLFYIHDRNEQNILEVYYEQWVCLWWLGYIR